MSMYAFKVRFQNLLRPIAFWLDRVGVSPNSITMGTCVISLLYATAMVMTKSSSILFYLLPVFFFKRMALNAIDGIIAKEKNKVTPLGTLLNEVCDVLSDTFLMAAFFFIPEIRVHLIWVFICLSIFVEFCGLCPLLLGRKRDFSGPLGKSDRGIVLTLMAWNVGGYIDHLIPNLYVNAIVAIAIPLLVWTAFNRLKKSFPSLAQDQNIHARNL